MQGPKLEGTVHSKTIGFPPGQYGCIVSFHDDSWFSPLRLPELQHIISLSGWVCPVAQEKLICMSECGSNDSSDDDVGGRASEWYEVGI